MKTSLVTISSLFATALFFSQLAFGSPAVLIEESPITHESSGSISSTSESNSLSSSSSSERLIIPLSQRASIHDVESQSFDDAFALRTKRRVGVGMSVMGQLGMAGGNLELNFTPENAMMLGFGGGPGYTAFDLGWKYLIGGRSFTPYISGGYASWHSSGGGDMSNSTPSALSSKFLSDYEKKTGSFDVGFLTPTAGLQYTQLSGEYLGWGGFIELTMMTKFTNGLAAAPLASLGGMYYF